MTQTLESPPRNHSARVQQVDLHMADLVARLKGPEFELVHPARWRHLGSGHHVETGYSYGEGRVRVFLGGGRTADHLFVLSGREDDMDAFNALFPVSSE